MPKFKTTQMSQNPVCFYITRLTGKVAAYGENGIMVFQMTKIFSEVCTTWTVKIEDKLFKHTMFKVSGIITLNLPFDSFQ